MNIKDNILNYLFDREYCISMYDDYFYIFNYKYLDFFNEKKIVVSIPDRKMSIVGDNLILVKITKEELLIKGKVTNVEVNYDE